MADLNRPPLDDGKKQVAIGTLFYKRWPWHLLYWAGYILFRSWVYYLTIKYYESAYLGYMVLSEIFLVLCTYFNLMLYRRLFKSREYLFYFATCALLWLTFLYGRTVFQFYWLQAEPSFRGSSFSDMFISNITFVFVYFLFLTACKYFKDGYMLQQFEARRQREHLLAEVDNLKAQIAPHFLFNTLNNLYGLAVEKSERLPALMLRLSDLLRHSLYETQKTVVDLRKELSVLESYIQLESIRLEKNLKLTFEDDVPKNPGYGIAPLLLIVFIENAFKHARLVQSQPVEIMVQTSLKADWFMLTIKNNYKSDVSESRNGLGLTNVKRRLAVLYPDGMHQLDISKDDRYFSITLKLKLVKHNGDVIHEL